MIKTIIKRDGREVDFDQSKITDAIYKAAISCGGTNRDTAESISDKVVHAYTFKYGDKTPTVEEIQDLVEQTLIKLGHDQTAKSYILYRNARSRMREAKSDLTKVINELTFSDSKDSDIKRENGNIDADTSMGTMLKYGSAVSKDFYLKHLIDPEFSEAHRNGDIHIHDLDFYAMTTTCTQIDLDKLFTDGFYTGHGFLREPNDISSYASLACIAIQSNQNDQHGGQSIPKFDYDLAKGVAKTFKKRYTDNLVRGIMFKTNIDKEEISSAVKTIHEDIEKTLGLVPSLFPSGDFKQAELQRLCLRGFKWKEPGKIGYHRFEVEELENIQSHAYQLAVEETDRATYQAMEALIHNLNTMHCLPCFEKIIVRDLKTHERYSIHMSDLYATFEKDRYLAMSYNIKEDKWEWKKITNIVNNGIRNRLIRTESKLGQVIYTTDNHRFITRDDYDCIYQTMMPEKVTEVLTFPYLEQLEKCKDKINSTTRNVYPVDSTFSEKFYDGIDVYDISVEDNENFINADGILVHNSRAGAQVPFSSINYGTDTSPEGRMIIKNVLLAQEAGLGHGETPIFPIHIFKVKEGINFNKEDPNYDMFKLACRVSAKRLFPNFEFIDAPFNIKYYKEGNPDTEIATMGAAVGTETVTIKVDSMIYRNIPISEAYSIIYDKCKFYWLGRHDAKADISRGTIGIYKITHEPTGKFYIGGSKDIKRRWVEHRYSIRHKGNLGDNYHTGDNNCDNYSIEILEMCDIDLLWERESYWYMRLNNELCVNYKDPINNGNFIKGSGRAEKAMKGMSYSDYENRGSTLCTNCDMIHVYALAHGSWTPIRNIIYNNLDVDLDLLRIHFDGRYIDVTVDHPLHTDIGRIEANELYVGDKLIDANDTTIQYPITKIEHIERQETYDFETDNDMFDLSGILSHNCRTRVIGNVHDPSREVVTGRGNLSFTSINLPRLAIEAKGDIDKFFNDLDKVMDLVIKQLKHRFKIQCQKHVYNFPFLMGQGVWMDSEKLSNEDDLSEVLKHGSLSVGFIGLAECLVSLIGKHHGESEEAQELGLKIIGHMRDVVDKEAEKTKLNFTLLATPAESLSSRFTRIDKKKYGVIPGVTDKDYYVNSYHVPPAYSISAFDKIRIEAPYHALTNAGHISYIEMDGDPTENLAAFEKIVRYMKQCGIGYGAINHPIDTDPVCGYTGIIKDECPHCGRKETDGGVGFERLRRITGYLTTTLDKWNDGKRAEEKDRVKHGVK